MKETDASYSFCGTFKAFVPLLGVALFFTISAKLSSAQILGIPDLPWTARDVVAISVGYEYNLSQKEADISFDLGIGFAM